MGGERYEYETESDRIKRRLRQELTTRQKLENWWNYHWHHVLIVLAAVGVMAYFGSSWGSALPEDYSVVWVGDHYLPDETEDALAAALAAYGEDVNGDGQVVVSVRQVGLDLRAVAERGTSGQQEYADLMALNADLNCGQSTVFILEDPEAFQAYSGALLYLDGAEPAEGAMDWENMTVSWQDAFGPLPEGMDSPVWLACRGCWKEEQRESWESSRQLWDRITAVG